MATYENRLDSTELEIWQVESLRLTAFPTVPVKQLKDEWWTKVVATIPDEIRRPRKYEHSFESDYGVGKLVLTANPIRIDWRWSKEALEPNNLPTIGSLSDSLDTFVGFMKNWLSLKSLPPVQRLAFGASFWQPTKDRAEAYQRLSHYIHAFDLNPENSSDFLYQINRQRVALTPIGGLRINRLAKWSVVQAGRSIFSDLGLLPTPNVCACRLELDINSAADFKGTLDHLVQLLEEFVGLAIEIAEKGDIP